jgi:hypothetical protein
MSITKTKERLVARLQQYWKIECLNIFLLPALAVFVVVSFFGAKTTPSLWLSLFACSWLLVLGTVALRMMLCDLQSNPSFGECWLPKLHRAQLPSAVLVAIALLAVLIEMGFALPSLTASHYASLLFAILALLEYINYYHRQLQHFDNATDFARLLAGQGFRRSHLARRLEKWRTKHATDA